MFSGRLEDDLRGKFSPFFTLVREDRETTEDLQNKVQQENITGARTKDDPDNEEEKTASEDDSNSWPSDEMKCDLIHQLQSSSYPANLLPSFLRK